jgi:hypothetical protein
MRYDKQTVNPWDDLSTKFVYSTVSLVIQFTKKFAELL